MKFSELDLSINKYCVFDLENQQEVEEARNLFVPLYYKMRELWILIDMIKKKEPYYDFMSFYVYYLYMLWLKNDKSLFEYMSIDFPKFYKKYNMFGLAGTEIDIYRLEISKYANMGDFDKAIILYKAYSKFESPCRVTEKRRISKDVILNVFAEPFEHD